MDWLNRLLAAIGIGGARVRIDLDDSEHPRGTEVRGHVVVEGGIVDQTVEALTLRMVEFEHRGRSIQTRELDAIVLGTDLAVEPNGSQHIPFALAIGDDALLTRCGALGNELAGTRLEAEAHIPWALNPRRTEALNVVNHREITAVQEALQCLGFRPASVRLRVLAPSPGTTVQDYEAQGDLARSLDGAALELSITDRYVIGRLVLNAQEHGIGDRLKALVGADRSGYGISIARAELLTSDGRPDVRSALPHLERILKAAVVDPQAPENVLLRAAQGPTDDPSRLVRPAGGTETRPDLLVRPADEAPAAPPLRPSVDGAEAPARSTLGESR